MKEWMKPEIVELDVKMTMDQVFKPGFDSKKAEANAVVPGLGDALGS